MAREEREGVDELMRLDEGCCRGGWRRVLRGCGSSGAWYWVHRHFARKIDRDSSEPAGVAPETSQPSHQKGCRFSLLDLSSSHSPVHTRGLPLRISFSSPPRIALRVTILAHPAAQHLSPSDFRVEGARSGSHSPPTSCRVTSPLSRDARRRRRCVTPYSVSTGYRSGAAVAPRDWRA